MQNNPPPPYHNYGKNTSFTKKTIKRSSRKQSRKINKIHSNKNTYPTNINDFIEKNPSSIPVIEYLKQGNMTLIESLKHELQEEINNRIKEQENKFREQESINKELRLSTKEQESINKELRLSTKEQESINNSLLATNKELLATNGIIYKKISNLSKINHSIIRRAVMDELSIYITILSKSVFKNNEFPDKKHPPAPRVYKYSEKNKGYLNNLSLYLQDKGVLDEIIQILKLKSIDFNNIANQEIQLPEFRNSSAHPAIIKVPISYLKNAINNLNSLNINEYLELVNALEIFRIENNIKYEEPLYKETLEMMDTYGIL